MSDDITVNDNRTRRCPMLGHDIRFSYCREPGSPTPCRKIFDCWFETFDVEAFIRTHYSEEQLRQITAPHKDKMLSLMELIEQAKRRSREKK